MMEKKIVLRELIQHDSSLRYNLITAFKAITNFYVSKPSTDRCLLIFEKCPFIECLAYSITKNLVTLLYYEKKLILQLVYKAVP